MVSNCDLLWQIVIWRCAGWSHHWTSMRGATCQTLKKMPKLVVIGSNDEKQLTEQVTGPVKHPQTLSETPFDCSNIKQVVCGAYFVLVLTGRLQHCRSMMIYFDKENRQVWGCGSNRFVRIY